MTRFFTDKCISSVNQKLSWLSQEEWEHISTLEIHYHYLINANHLWLIPCTLLAVGDSENSSCLLDCDILGCFTYLLIYIFLCASFISKLLSIISTVTFLEDHDGYVAGIRVGVHCWNSSA